MGAPHFGRASQRKAIIGAIERKRTPRTDRVATQTASGPNGARQLGKGYGLVCRKEREDLHTVYQLVKANQVELPVRALCETPQGAFGNRCREMGIRLSMGTVGDAYDNAMAQSFFASLECELIARRSWKTKTEARMAVFT